MSPWPPCWSQAQTYERPPRIAEGDECKDSSCVDPLQGGLRSRYLARVQGLGHLDTDSLQRSRRTGILLVPTLWMSAVSNAGQVSPLLPVGTEAALSMVGAGGALLFARLLCSIS